MSDHRPQVLAQLRTLMKEKGWDALVFTGTDPHESEYLPDHWQVRSFLTGFTGSAGLVALTQDQGGLWTDSRYHIQAAQELAGSGYALFKEGLTGVPSVASWLGSHLAPGARVAVDASTCSLARLRKWEAETVSRGLVWVPEPISFDAFWPQRPPLPHRPLWDYQDTRLANQETVGIASRQEKIATLRQSLTSRGGEVLLVSALDEVAWTLNLRGSDVDYNPVFLSWLVVSGDAVTLFVQEQALAQGLAEVLKNEGITPRPYQNWIEELPALVQNRRVVFAPETTNSLVGQILSRTPGCQTMEASPSPVTTLKARKSPRELQLIRRAMVHDGAALVKFLCWFARCKNTPDAKDWTETSLAEKLEGFRQGNPTYRGPSFHPISAFKAHGAIVHYSAQGPGQRLEGNGLLLLDTGAQYLEGTTDITRTLALGQVSSQEKEDYTLVLRAHIRAASAQFPQGTRGYSIDAQARSVLWERGLNYGHGTGHGVGHFLCVHEGPVRLNAEPLPYPLEVGQVLSNEPGLYRPGLWGIRLENLQTVVEKQQTDFGVFLGWETLTLCPFDRELILAEHLDRGEKGWLNEYHREVRARLSSFLTDTERTWLELATAPI